MILAEDIDTSILGPRQRGVLTVIRDWVVRHGYPPSTRDIGDAVGVSASAVGRHLRDLGDRGYLRRGRSVTRTVIGAAPHSTP